ncbi:hypothetical protein DOT_4313 [Desulfosporosinus sp. OT]|nr:hypothetical protein DOT_4313 [Desulfosporosinus sp. OT]
MAASEYGGVRHQITTIDSRKGARRGKFGEGSGTTSPRLR